MKVENKIYVLQNDKNPIKFMYNRNKDGAIDDEYREVDDIREATQRKLVYTKRIN